MMNKATKGVLLSGFIFPGAGQFFFEELSPWYRFISDKRRLLIFPFGECGTTSIKYC